jgi:hypothetical protein
MNDVKKSALWALVSIPISVLLLGALLHGGGILEIVYLPVLIAEELLGDYGLAVSYMFPIQYLGYFLLIYVLIKIKKVLKNTRAENIAREQSENNEPGL